MCGLEKNVSIFKIRFCASQDEETLEDITPIKVENLLVSLFSQLTRHNLQGTIRKFHLDQPLATILQPNVHGYEIV